MRPSSSSAPPWPTDGNHVALRSDHRFWTLVMTPWPTPLPRALPSSSVPFAQGSFKALEHFLRCGRAFARSQVAQGPALLSDAGQTAGVPLAQGGGARSADEAERREPAQLARQLRQRAPPGGGGSRGGRRWSDAPCCTWWSAGCDNWVDRLPLCVFSGIQGRLRGVRPRLGRRPRPCRRRAGGGG